MMGRWLALLSTAALIIAAAAIDPCKRQPFRGRCPSVGNQPPKRSQFVLRYYARNGECVSYPYGHCTSDESEPQLYRYKEECEDSCINNTPQNLGVPKSPEENQTYGTVTPLKESPTVSLQKEPSPKSEAEITIKSTTVTSPPTTESTTTETVTTTEKATTEEPTTEAPTTEAPVTTAAPTSSSTEHVTTQSVSETTDEEVEEEEEEEEENSVNNEEKVQESSSTQTTTKVPITSPARTECERRREASSSSKIRGGFVPVCDSNGNFQKVQCEPDGRQCFCVNTNGIEITNSRTRNGAHPDCTKIETAVSPRAQSCTGQAERGPCSSSYTRFYYDEATSKCNIFSYSGCGGNGNNFETESECTRRCVPSKPTVAQPQPTAAPARTTNDLCSLPKERGPCDKYELRFYYNADTKECKYFFWGGCEGNGNNFETAEACQSACGVGKATQHNIPRTFAHSSGPIKTIPGVRIGNGSVSSVTGEEIVEVTARPTTVQPIATQPTTRFVSQTVPPTTRGVTVAQQTTQRTHAPTTTGAPPSPSTSAPVPPTPARPSTPVVVLPANRCAHPLDSGSCRGQFVRWFWDSKRNACDVFTYSGCEGNGNNFASREECLAICHKKTEPAPVPPQPDFSNVCKHDIDSGECTGVFQRFAFDTEKEECRPFTYGGCGGNGNNFATMPECQAKCERTEESPVNVCEFEIEAGECTGVFPRFAYDHENNDCRPFTYGGCGGNGNNFASINECRNVCVKKSCLPVSQCDLSHCQIVNDNRGCPFCSCAPPKLPIPSPQCPPLDASRCLEPCIVISNRRGCQECACPHLQSTVVPPVAIEPRPPGTNHQTARPPATPERVAPPAPQSNRIIATIPGVQEVSKSPLPPGVTNDIQDKCLQPMETGPCKQFVDRWFFNKEDGSCHPFKYGGCAGNRNHFFTQRECEIHCSRFLHEPLAPNELTESSTSHEHDARDSSQEFVGSRSRLAQQRALAFDLPSLVRGQQTLQTEPKIPDSEEETYETRGPIRIDQAVKEYPTTTQTRAPVQEYTTGGILITQPTKEPRVLPIERRTEVRITTRGPIEPPVRIPLSRAEELEAERTETAPNFVKRVLEKKIPLRQEAANSQPRKAENTYSMHAVTNYDPQGNNNLEGLSPPVDPTYFTYNSQHLGKRKQFAVNNVPFDKNGAGFVPLQTRPQVVQTEAERRFETALTHEPHGIDDEVEVPGGLGAQPQVQPFRGFPPQQNFIPQNPQFRQQVQEQQFFQQRVFIPQQNAFAPVQPSSFRPSISQANPQFFAAQQAVPRVPPQPVQSTVRSDTIRTQTNRPPPPAWQQPAPTRSPPPPPPATSRPPVQTSQQLTRVSSDHLENRQEPVRTAQSNNVSNTSAGGQRFQPPRKPIIASDSFENFEFEGPGSTTRRPVETRPSVVFETTRVQIRQQGTTAAPSVTQSRQAFERQSQSTPFIEPIRQLFQPSVVQNAVKTVVSQDKLPLNALPIHKLENTTPLIPKRIVFKEGEPNEPIIHGIRSGPYGQTHWVYFDGDYYGPLIPGIKVNKTDDMDKVDATIAVQENPAARRAYETFKVQSVDFHKSLNAFIKQKEEEQAKREMSNFVATAPPKRTPQGVVVIPVGEREESIIVPVVRTENTRFKDVNKLAEQKLTSMKVTDQGSDTDIIDLPKFLQAPPRTNQPNAPVFLNPLENVLTNAHYDNFQRHFQANSSILLGEVSEEISGEKDEFEVPFPPRKAAGVSSVHVLEPLPVENYRSPEPPLRGAYGKKNYLEPATTQGVKIVTSTARPSTTTTTPTTTRTTTTASTTVKIEENVDAEEEEEEEPEEITTTAAPLTTEVVAEAPKKTVKEELERLASEVGKDVREEQTEEEEEEVEEETTEASTTASVPTSRASRLLETATEAAEEEEEEIEEKEEASGSVETTPVKAPEAPLPVVEAIEKALELQTAKPEVETTLMNEINSMEGEEGLEENEITPSSMMSSSKFAVHRQTEEAHRFEEVTPDLKQVPVENKEELHGTILKKVEITRPPTTTAPPTTKAPSTEAATQAESSTPSTTKVAESTTSAGTIQSSVQNVQITESTSTASQSVSTKAPTTPTTTQARPITAIDKDEEPTFDPNAVKKEINEPKASGVAQVTVEPNNGIGRQPVPLGSELNLPEMDPKDIEDLEEPTTIFPTTKSASVRPTTPNAQQGPTAQTTRGFDSHDPKIICAMPADAGYCEKYEARWFFNSQTGQCDQFSYGGCAGNMNNFVNRTLCELSCMASHPGLASQVPERCSYDKDAGFGKGYNVKWYFNMRNLRCEQFVYEGKGGNSNQFETLSDCERFCSPQPTRPTQVTRPTLATVVPIQAATTRTPTAVPRVEATQSTAVPTRAAATNSPLVPLPTVPKQPIIDDNDAEYEVDAEDETDATLAPPFATRGPIPPAPTNILPSLPINPPGTEPKPPAFGSLTNVQSAIKAVNVNEATHTSSAPKATAAPVASTQSPESATYKAEAIKPHNLGIDQSNLKPTEKIVAPSPKETVNYQTGQSAKVQGLANFNDGRLPPPDTDDIKNLDEKTIRPSCPNGNKELRYTDGRPVMCLPGHKQCPDKSVCYFNGMDYFCCPNEDDPYDRHVFGGYGGDEARNGYKVFGPLRIRRLMDEVPLRAKRQTSIDKAFNTNPVSFNLDSVVAPLRFDSEKPRHVSRASMMRKPNPPKHGNPMCILPLVKGDCNAAHLRYYYDRTSDSCRLFYYSGCQGNANNFGSLEDCQRLCVLGGQIAPAVQADAVTPATIIAPGQCPTGSPLGGSLPVLCGNSTESIGCPTGYYCRGGPPDICCPGVDPVLKSVQHGVKTLPETTPVPGVPRNYYKEQLISTPLYMCPDASDPLMGENGVPAVCGAGFDGVKMCPKGYYCAIDGAKGSRLCCPLFGSSASKIPTESVYAPTLSRRNPNPGEVIDRGSLPFDQAKYDRNERIELPTPTTAAPTTTEAPEEEEEYEDDEDPQKLRIKGDSRNQAMQEDAASNSSKAVDISQEPVNIDVPKEEEPAEEPAQPTDTPVKPVFDKSICQLKPTEGRACREDEKAPKTNLHYFYSAKDRRCKLYFYRGCGGSANRFEKKADCEALCLNA